MIVVFILSVLWWISKPGLWNFLMGGTACGEIWVLLQWSKERYTHLNTEFQKIARRDKKAFLSNQCKEIEENNGMGKIEISSRKLEIPREHFMQRWAQ